VIVFVAVLPALSITSTVIVFRPGSNETVLFQKVVPDASSPLTLTSSITAPGVVGYALPETVIVSVLTSALSLGVVISNKGALASAGVVQNINMKAPISNIRGNPPFILFMLLPHLL